MFTMGKGALAPFVLTPAFLILVAIVAASGADNPKDAVVNRPAASHQRRSEQDEPALRRVEPLCHGMARGAAFGRSSVLVWRQSVCRLQPVPERAGVGHLAGSITAADFAHAKRRGQRSLDCVGDRRLSKKNR